MTKSKHDWNWLEDYLNIHETVLARYHGFMTRREIYNYKWVTGEHLELSTSFVLKTHNGNTVKVSIEKDVEIQTLTPPRTRKSGRKRARLEGYTYVAYEPTRGCLLRYCSPHDQLFDKDAHHHEFHHKHDLTSGIEAISNTGDDWPHVSEFLDEVMSRL